MGWESGELSYQYFAAKIIKAKFFPRNVSGKIQTMTNYQSSNSQPWSFASSLPFNIMSSHPSPGITGILGPVSLKAA